MWDLLLYVLQPPYLRMSRARSATSGSLPERHTEHGTVSAHAGQVRLPLENNKKYMLNVFYLRFQQKVVSSREWNKFSRKNAKAQLRWPSFPPALKRTIQAALWMMKYAWTLFILCSCGSICVFNESNGVLVRNDRGGWPTQQTITSSGRLSSFYLETKIFWASLRRAGG